MEVTAFKFPALCKSRNNTYRADMIFISNIFNAMHRQLHPAGHLLVYHRQVART